MKKKYNFKKWEQEAVDLYWEKAYKRVYENIHHNKMLVKRLQTKDGADAIGSEKAKEEITKSEQYVKDQQSELEFVKKMASQ
mgnify:CR=1 FL=1